jgi:tetratricopeptide (TPR) repeat protein
MSKPGRNDACPCGSGKKYKKCCLPRDEAARPRVVLEEPGGGEEPEPQFTAELRPEVDEKVDRLLQKLELGAGRAVEPEIRALLAKHPRYHMTHYLMGVYNAMVLKNPDGAIPHFEKAVQILPPFAEAHFNLATAAQQTFDILKTIRAYRAAMRYSQGKDGVGEMARAQLEKLEKIVGETSPFPNLDAYVANAKLFDDAFACLNNRNFKKAVELFELVLSQNPSHVQSFGNLALAYAGLGRRAEAMKCFERALELDPKYEPARINRGVVGTMREGEPFIPDGIQETHYYAEQLHREGG